MGIEHLGDEAGADALDHVRPLWPARQHRRSIRLDGHHAEGWLARFEHLAHAGDGAARANACHQDIGLAIGIAPDLLGGGAAVDLGVGGVLELHWDEVARVSGSQLFGLADRAVHAFAAGGQDQLGAVGAQQDAALFAHRVWHGEHALVTLGRAHHGQGDASVTAGWLEDDGIGLDLPGLFGGFDHRGANAVFDRVGRVVELQLGDYLGRQPGCQALDAYQRGVADQICNIIRDFHNSLL